ncbi:TPA: DNA cytosine methyltransferase [Burkholderia vietnamiensis]|nr:DNA cytosine methyltransferase [Burkholderia vietnamiensis]HDR9184698.1 DNA cytosine methyltransferase [Burkholderia vietnamiensis]
MGGLYGARFFSDLRMRVNELHLFAGAGGGILAGQLRGNRCVCAVEFDPYAQAVLVARQNDGTFPPFPIWDDVRTFDGRPWRGIVDIVAGGFPCQDVSAAGTGDGLDGERSGLWTEMARIIREIQPLGVEVENSPMLTSRGLGRVLGDLAEMGFDVEWGVLSAADTDAPHLRERIWIRGYLADTYRAWQSQHAWREREFRMGTVERGEALADAGRGRRDRAEGRQMEQPRRAEVECGSEVIPNALRDRRGQRPDQQEPESGGCGTPDAGDDGSQGNVADAVREREQRIVAGSAHAQEREGSFERSDRPRGYGFGRWPAEPGMGRVVDGMAHRAHRIKALGNGQVPRVAATAFTLLKR